MVNMGLLTCIKQVMQYYWIEVYFILSSFFDFNTHTIQTLSSITLKWFDYIPFFHLADAIDKCYVPYEIYQTCYSPFVRSDRIILSFSDGLLLEDTIWFGGGKENIEIP